MKRRTFLILGSLGLVGNLCGQFNRLFPSAPVDPPAPTGTSLPKVTPAPSNTAFQPRAIEPDFEPTLLVETPTTTATLPATETAQSAGDLVAEEFDDPVHPLTRAIRADSASQVIITEGRLQIRGIAPGPGDPGIFDTRPIPCVDGQVVGVRLEAAFGKETGRVGLVSMEGQNLASLRRTAAEGEGGIIECGTAAAPILNLYSGCWYDFVVFLQSGGTAFAINDGAGLELVLVSEANRSTPGYLGYWARGGEDQDASLDSWYALGPRCFPPALVSQSTASLEFEADIATNAAWVETRLTRAGGNAGLRIRSVDRDNEYRVYLDGTDLKVDQVTEGIVSPIATQPMPAVPGGKLAARYNELTLTVYYNGVATQIINRKIGAPGLLAGTKIGIYSTHPENTFTGLIARAVRLEVPDELNERLLNSRRVLCLGDSLTTADKAFGYQNLLRKRLGDAWATVDGGVSGQTTYQMLSRLPSHLSRYRPKVVVVLGGTNDIDRNHKETAVIANLQAIYRTATQAGAQVAAVTLPPRGHSKGWTDEKQAILEKINGAILGAGVDYRIHAYQLLKDPGDICLLAAYDSGDHVHLSGSGYNALADAIFREVAW